MPHASRSVSASPYGPEISRQTNFTDYEKVHCAPDDRFFQPERNLGPYDDLLRPCEMSSGPPNSHRLGNDQHYSYTTGGTGTTPGRDLGYNIPTQGDAHTSPTSNLQSSSFNRRQSTPRTKHRDFRQNNLSSDQLYDMSRYRSPLEERRNTLLPEADEESVFQALQPDENPGMLYTGPAIPYSSTSQSSLSKAPRANAHSSSLESLPRYAHTPTNSLLRRSHQELTDSRQWHHRSGSLQTSGDQLRRTSNRTPSVIDVMPARASTNLPGDLSKWQQLHKQQLALQQADSKVLTSLSTKSSSLSSLQSYDFVSGLEKNCDTVGAFRNAADEIIQEKDTVIENLRLKLLQLESPYQSSYTSRCLTDSEVARLKQHAQDLEYQNTLLKTRLAEAASSQQSKIENLELQLGATEHELVSVKSDLTDKQKRSRMESAEIETKIMEKERQVAEWQRRFMEMRDSHLEVRQKLDSLERYLSDLPTAEDSQHTAQQLNTLQEEVSVQKTTISNLERRMTMAKKIITVKDRDLDQLKEQNSQLESRLSMAETELEEIKTKGLGEELAKAQANVEKSKQEKERLRIDLEKAKKMLEAQHRLAQQVEVRHKGETTQLEERLQQEEDAMNALREESSNMETQIIKLKKSIRDLSTQNQDLLEQNMIQKDQLSTFERHCSEETLKLERQLAREMRLCFAQLQGLVQVCCDRADGHDLDMSMLLDTRGTEVDSDEEYSQSSQSGSSQASSNSGRNTVNDALTLKNRLAKVKDLKKQMEKLREIITDKIAEDLASKIECTTQ
ncbi:centrosomal protein of 85 kDa-like [Liolophura sinensis]|uniref:centrosomal protein of 85 kDa-like n=1 Tax=Liolophura sinensis TaxID=3198878 RepID=UPI003157F7D3